MLIYWLVYSVLFIAVLFDVRYFPFSFRKRLLFLLVSLFSLFRGLRWETGSDWSQYLSVYQNSTWDNIFSFHRYGFEVMEFGYMFINVLSKEIFGSYTVFLLVTNLFILISYALFAIRHSPFPVITFAIILLIYGFFPVRQNLAIAIALFGIPYFFKKKHFGFFVIVFSAFSVHSSAIAFLLLYFLRFQLSFSFSVLILGFSIFIGENIEIFLTKIIGFLSVFGNVFAARLLTYMHISSFDSTRGLFSMAMPILFYFIFLLFRSKVEVEKRNVYNVFLNLYLVTIVIAIFFFSYFVELNRIASLFAFSFGVLFAYVFQLVNKQKSEVMSLGYFFLIAYLLVKFYGWLDFFPEAHFPYKSIFNSL